jgi:hypothetical protein
MICSRGMVLFAVHVCRVNNVRNICLVLPIINHFPFRTCWYWKNYRLSRKETWTSVCGSLISQVSLRRGKGEVSTSICEKRWPHSARTAQSEFKMKTWVFSRCPSFVCYYLGVSQTLNWLKWRWRFHYVGPSVPFSHLLCSSLSHQSV